MLTFFALFSTCISPPEGAVCFSSMLFLMLCHTYTHTHKQSHCLILVNYIGSRHESRLYGVHCAIWLLGSGLGGVNICHDNFGCSSRERGCMTVSWPDSGGCYKAAIRWTGKNTRPAVQPSLLPWDQGMALALVTNT